MEMHGDAKSYAGRPAYLIQSTQRRGVAIRRLRRLDSDLSGFYMAIGASGNQYKNAPIAGVMMAKLIDACENGLDHDKTPYMLDFKYTNRQFDVGFFSRNREINRNSSFSVIG